MSWHLKMTDRDRVKAEWLARAATVGLSAPLPLVIVVRAGMAALEREIEAKSIRLARPGAGVDVHLSGGAILGPVTGDDPEPTGERIPISDA